MENIGLYRTKKNNDAILPEQGPFSSFHCKVFFANISFKIFKHMLKDKEFCSKFRDIFQISVKPLLKHFSYFLVFGSSQLDN